LIAQGFGFRDPKNSVTVELKIFWK